MSPAKKSIKKIKTPPSPPPPPIKVDATKNLVIFK